jgi:DNA polymerase V
VPVASERRNPTSEQTAGDRVVTGEPTRGQPIPSQPASDQALQADGSGAGADAGSRGEPQLHSPSRLARPWRRQPLPLAGMPVAAGFPSPADDYIESRIDLNDTLIRHPSSTFFLRVSGDSMRDAGILDGDLLVVDRAVEPRHGRVVVAVVEGAFTLKHLRRHHGRWRLEAAHPDYPPLELEGRDDSQIWGVAIHAIHSL